MNGIPPFDPIGELPQGRVVLEASAGTGKTWTIAALATRYVAEAGVPIEKLLVVTFTRAATGELRDRVRARLSQSLQFLATPGLPAGGDAVLAHLADAPAPQRDLHRRRLEQALAGFDRATITTLHGFAARLLRGLGLLSGAPASLTLAADHGSRLAEAISDMAVQRFATAPGQPLRLADIKHIAAAVLNNLDAIIIPEPGQAAGIAEVRAGFARDLRREVSCRAERAGVLTYDELLLRTRDALADPAVGPLARRVMGRRFAVALIDEFQDTDRLQWEIADLLFPIGGTTLAVIGDPKQAIYAFRGADVDAYLAARETADVVHTLRTNWRSDQPLITGLDQLLQDVAFGDERISYQPVEACHEHRQAAIEGAGAPIQIRQVLRHDSLLTKTRKALAVAEVRRFVADDVGAYAVALLTGGVTIKGQPAGPGDLAVLCRTHRHIKAVQAALAKRGVPAVVARSGSVLDTPAAFDWLVLLNALELPSAGRVRQAAVGPFVGLPAERLAAAGDDAVEQLHEHIGRWREDMRRGGIPALVASLEAETGMAGRVLSATGGARHLTDLYHVAELLHAAHRAGGIRSLASWLGDQIAEANSDRGAEEAETRIRRLDTDREAVQLLTIHGVKGLEFPVVLCPFLWDLSSHQTPVPVFHPAPNAARRIDAGGAGWPGFAVSKKRAVEEQQAEEMRLMYVALTRARHHLVIWWAPTDGAKGAPLSRILFRGSATAGVPGQIHLQDDAAHAQQLAALAAGSGGTIEAAAVSFPADRITWRAPEPESPELAVAAWTRPIDTAWRRASFSGLTAAGRDRPPPADGETGHKDDEPQAPGTEPPGAAPLPFDDLGGLEFGTLIHDILEAVDPAGPGLRDRLLAAAGPAIARSGLVVAPEALAAWLEAAACTPLFADPASPTLQTMAGAGRVPELEFELPVATGGTGSRMAVSTADLADLLEAHLPAAHVLAPYPARLRALEAPRFRGYLTGFVDVVVRLPGGGAFWVADYKTNRLLPPVGRPADEAYFPSALAEEMIREHYVLQALLYQAALHRYLRSRLHAYDPATHLGGAIYLFLRGMSGPTTPAADEGRRGVFTWPASVALIEDLDHLLRRGRPA